MHESNPSCAKQKKIAHKYKVELCSSKLRKMVWWNLLGCIVFPEQFYIHSWNNDKVGMFKSQYPINSKKFIVHLVCKAQKEIALCFGYEKHL